MGQKPLKSNEAVAESRKIRSDLLFNFDYGMDFRRKVGKSGGQTFYSLGRDPKPKDKSKKISPKHEFVDYLLNLENGNLDLDVLYAYTRTFKESEEPEISIYDTTDIKYNGKTINTTIGRLLINRVIFYQLWDNPYFHYINDSLNEKKLTSEFKYIAQLIIEKKVDPNKISLNRMIDLYQEMGLRLSTMFNSSVTYTMLNPDEGMTKIRDDVFNSKEMRDAITNTDLVTYEKNVNKIIDEAKEYYKDDDMVELYESKGKADWNNDFKNMTITQGPMASLSSTKPKIVTNPLIDGTPIEAIPTTINVAMTSAVNRGVDTAKGGSNFKELTNAMQSIKGFDHDCGSTKGEVVHTSDMWDLLNRYVIENGESKLITLDNVNKYLNRDVEIRSPFHCLEKNGHYCSRCIGRTAFEMINSKVINLGIYTTDAASGLMNLFMKSTHNLGTSTFIIKNLDEYLYPKPNKPLFYIDKDPIENVDKVYCNEDISWRVPAAAVKKSGTEYKILAHGSVITSKDGHDYAMVLGTEIPSSPSEVLRPEQKFNDIDKHHIFKYYKGQAISNTTVTLREANTVYKMFNLFLQGNVSSLPPIEAHKMTLMNTFKTNKQIGASPITFDIILSTLARDANDLNKPARETGGENYKFISCQDMTIMSGSFNALFGPDAVRGMVISAAKTYDEQTGKPSPIEKALRM